MGLTAFEYPLPRGTKPSEPNPATAPATIPGGNAAAGQAQGVAAPRRSHTPGALSARSLERDRGQLSEIGRNLEVGEPLGYAVRTAMGHEPRRFGKHH